MKSIFNTKEYNAWASMRRRIRCKTNADYPQYGGRGIEICEAWNSFGIFLHDVGFAPSPQHSLDRIDVNGNYEPSNVKWSTAREQSLNRRNTLQATMNGVTKPVIDWANEHGVKYQTVRYRMIERNMPIEMALTKGKI